MWKSLSGYGFEINDLNLTVTTSGMWTILAWQMKRVNNGTNEWMSDVVAIVGQGVMCRDMSGCRGMVQVS